MRGASVYRNQNKTKGAAAARRHDQTHREEEHPRNHLLKSRRRRNTGVWSALPWPRVALRYSRGCEHAQQVTMIIIFPDKWPHTAHQAPPLLGWLLKDLGQGGTATAMPTPSRARAQERFRVSVRKPIFPAPGPEPQPCDKHTQPQKALLALRRDPLLPTLHSTRTACQIQSPPEGWGPSGLDSSGGTPGPWGGKALFAGSSLPHGEEGGGSGGGDERGLITLRSSSSGTPAPSQETSPAPPPLGSLDDVAEMSLDKTATKKQAWDRPGGSTHPLPASWPSTPPSLSTLVGTPGPGWHQPSFLWGRLRLQVELQAGISESPGTSNASFPNATHLHIQPKLLPRSVPRQPCHALGGPSGKL